MVSEINSHMNQATALSSTKLPRLCGLRKGMCFLSTSRGHYLYAYVCVHEHPARSGESVSVYSSSFLHETTPVCYSLNRTRSTPHSFRAMLSKLISKNSFVPAFQSSSKQPSPFPPVRASSHSPVPSSRPPWQDLRYSFQFPFVSWPRSC